MQTIILDFDGTIADTKNSIIETVQETLKVLGYPPANEEDIQRVIGLPLSETFIQCAHITEEKPLAKAIRIYRSKYNDISLRAVRLFPEVEKTLQYLHQKGITITVASSKGKEALYALLETLGIFGYISLIVGEQDVKNKKPAPDMALLIIEQTKSLPHETMVVGDTIFDIAMGQDAGCITCGVTYGNHTREQLKTQHADYIIDNFKDIIGFIK